MAIYPFGLGFNSQDYASVRTVPASQEH